ncbi:thiol:disulfide interchange protein [Chryseobacterium contaminans]|uniref:Thiol:disulfide interchange protein n=1 Tax=Chryseobacterium contaminans TaxID=1423959 RepID=A0A1M6Z183_9FLAO|nr:thioredoxin family protein [Chryseobacterium contaminans]OCA72769.1 thiol:disulfide interchange protein [Chryseobacterium contaminans]SHL24268.1 Thiol:disulfide interchange protein DsbD [Chryseobacterium contaminans]
MKKLIWLLAFFTVVIFHAQDINPVAWKTSVEKISDKEYNLVATAIIKDGWHLYSQEVMEGPAATAFMYDDSAGGFTLVGNTAENEGKTIEDPVFKLKVKTFIGEVVFKQKVNIEGKPNPINATVEYMVGNTSKVLPVSSADLMFDLKNVAAAPEKKGIKTAAATETENTADRGLLAIFLLSFFSGFAALLTPCVFPMIPMTVSFFTKQSKTKAAGIRNATIYGISIIVIYVILGSLVTGIFGADSLNALSTNVWFNLIFFILLIIFAISFLGAFDIVLPSKFANKVDSQADRGGMVGIFFMALTLAVVSFSCTGPIVGTLLVQAASKGGIAPIVGMLGFSTAIALPFSLFAAFPGWLNALPKSGSWLNTVKVVLGFLELALAFKFLSNADLVLQLHWLEREVFLAIWIAIFGSLALYLFGKITLPHDSPLNFISVGRLCLGIIVLSFTIYLIPGLWGAQLKLISGFPPPMNYSESPKGVGGGAGKANGTDIASALPEGAESGPHDIPTFHDYNKGIAYAKKVGKPVMLDFTGYACVNCRKMEEKVWPDEKVLNHLKNDVVVVSLYVDDKRELPENERFKSEITGKEIEYTGQKWSEFQILKYQTNAQPYYVLIDHEGNNLNAPTAYNPDINAYQNWLEDGIKKFKK